MLYQVYERIPMFEYLTETYTTIIEQDLQVENIEQRNQAILQRIIEGNSGALDLSSLFSLSIDSILEFISVS